MEKNSTMALFENLIINWNGEFPDYPLTVPDLKKPHSVMGSLLLVFDRLGINRDAVLAPPPEECCNENMKYYWDLLPVINITRVVNHLVSFMPRMDVKLTITHFLQPIATTSHSVLLVLFNLMIFNDNRLREIQPHEEVLFARIDEVKSLEDKKNKLLEMLNEQALEKENRSDRLKKIDSEIKQFEEELNKEKEDQDQEQQELQAMIKEDKQIELAVEQKKGQKDALIAEIEKKQAMRVYDADDIKIQAEQAAQNVQDAEEKLESLRNTLMQKENSLKNLQTIKPNLDAANNLLHEIMKLSESLRDYENGDLDTDSKEGELEDLNTELSELEVQLAEIKAARVEAATKRQEAHAKRQRDRAVAQNNLRDAEEKDKKCKERCKKAVQRTQEIKDMTNEYEQEKAKGFEELSMIQQSFENEIKSMDSTLIQKVIDVKKEIEYKLKNKNS